MDTLTKYQQIVEQTLLEASQQFLTEDGFETLISMDAARGQYILMSDGWEGSKRYYSPIIHIEVKPSGIIWLRLDNTDLEIGQTLINKGVDKQDIVLAFYSPSMRKYAQEQR